MYRKPPVITKGDTFQTARTARAAHRVDTAAKEGGRVADLIKSLNALEGEERRPSFRDSQTGSWRRPSGSNVLRVPTIPTGPARHEQTIWRPSPYHINDGAAPDGGRGLFSRNASPSPGHIRTETPDRPNPFKRRDSSGSEVVASPVPRRESISRKAFERVRTMSQPTVPEDQPFLPVLYHHHDDTIESYISHRLSERWSPAPASVSSVVHTPQAPHSVDAPPPTPYPAGHVDTPFALDILRNIDHILSDHTAALKAVITRSEQLLHQNEQHCQSGSSDHTGGLVIPTLASAASEPFARIPLRKLRSLTLPESSSSASGPQHLSYAPSLDDPPRTLRKRTSSISALVQLIDDTASSFRSDPTKDESTELPPRKPSLKRRPSYRSSIATNIDSTVFRSHTPSPPFHRPRSAKSGSVAITPPRIKVAPANQPLPPYDLVSSSAFACLPAAPITPPEPSPQPFITLVHPMASPTRLQRMKRTATSEFSIADESPSLMEYDRDAALAGRASFQRASLADLTEFLLPSHSPTDGLPKYGQHSLVFPGQSSQSPEIIVSQSVPQSTDVTGNTNEFFPQMVPKVEVRQSSKSASSDRPPSPTIPFPISPQTADPPFRRRPTSPSPSPPVKKATRTITTKSSKSVRGSKGTMKTRRPEIPSLGAVSGPVTAPTMMAHETQSRVKNARGFWARDGDNKARSERTWFQKRSGGVGSEQSIGRGSSSMG
jgi:hypothetical protein